MTRPCNPVSRWALASRLTATGLEASAPNTELLSTAPTVIVCAEPKARTVTRSPGSAPIAPATLAGSIRPPAKRKPASPSLRALKPPRLTTDGVTPSSCTDCRPRGPSTATFSRSTGAATWTPARRAACAEEPFVEPILRARRQLEPCRADELMDELSGRAGQAGVGDQDAQHQRHADRDPAARQQLLDGVRAQPDPVQVRQHAQADPRDRGVQGALHDEVAASSGSIPSVR